MVEENLLIGPVLPKGLLENKEPDPEDHEYIEFLDTRLLQLEEIDPKKIPQIREQIIYEIKNERNTRVKTGKTSLTEEDIFGFYQYCPRSLERSGGVPTYIDFEISRYAGRYSEETFQSINQLINYVYKNLEGEADEFIKQHGENIENIIDEKGNLVFVCTHPSWNTLFLPYIIMAKMNKEFINKGQTSLILAPGPLMSKVEVLGNMLSPRDILMALGINILITMPPDKKNYEKNEKVRSLGQKIRHNFQGEITKEKTRMVKDGGRIICIAPEGKATKYENDEYHIKPMSLSTEGLLVSMSQMNKTHFVVLGMQEKGGEFESSPRDLIIKAKLIDNKKLKEMPQKRGEFGKVLDQDMADLVNGRVQQEL